MSARLRPEQNIPRITKSGSVEDTINRITKRLRGKTEVLRRMVVVIIYSGIVKKSSGRQEKNPSVNASERVRTLAALVVSEPATRREMNSLVFLPLR